MNEEKILKKIADLEARICKLEPSEEEDEDEMEEEAPKPKGDKVKIAIAMLKRKKPYKDSKEDDEEE